MILKPLHPWKVTPKEAVQIQKRLCRRLKFKTKFSPLKRIAGCDLAFSPDGRNAIAVVIVYSWPELKELERAYCIKPVHFPYVPGLLTFREGPALLKVFEKLKHRPDLYIFDGQGMAHPRSMGIAAHMGLWLGKPAIGCAKSKLFGIETTPGSKAGDFSFLLHPDGHKIGAVLRTSRGARPVYVSPGHKIDIQTSLKVILRCLDGFRIPKPTREADRYAAQIKRSFQT